MVSWAVELSEFEITFERKVLVKAQVLVDFVNEMSSSEKTMEVGEWSLSVDGSSNIKGSEAEIILEGPGGVTVEQSLKFDFKASNNQAEYEAIIAGLKKRLGEAKGLWAEELITVIWAYNTTPQSTTGESPFKLTYGVDAMIPAELQDVTFRVATYNEDQNDMNRLVDLNLAVETQAEVRLRQAMVKHRSERRYNSRVVMRQMKVGDLVLRRKNSRPEFGYAR
ncbi:uncharacterized protein LOC130748057 [Lotus japonicus]|uniref:uncharacterized protein LOC130748057 n=1 Tax=Lotus japonicus TaxID=34305 RepID=UPI00258AD951|nr:uncharacterized protein LOC130748057 [Lotus japonicus]